MMRKQDSIKILLQQINYDNIGEVFFSVELKYQGLLLIKLDIIYVSREMVKESAKKLPIKKKRLQVSQKLFAKL